MDNFSKKCFVCGTVVTEGEFSINTEINLPVCNNCKGSTNEKLAITELQDGMADGFVCGCI